MYKAHWQISSKFVFGDSNFETKGFAEKSKEITSEVLESYFILVASSNVHSCKVTKIENQQYFC